MKARSPKDSLKKFAKDGRAPLTIAESMALLLQYPKTLQDHYVVSTGTFFVKDGDEVPLLWIDDDNHNPELHYAWFDIAHGNYGAVSCALRIGN